MQMIVVLVFSAVIFSSVVSVDCRPICRMRTPGSLLDNKRRYKPLFLGPYRARYGTCTGVSWFHDNYLVTANLHGRKLNVYKFDKKAGRCRHIQQIDNTQEARLHLPENMHISPDGTLLAVCYCFPCIQFYSIDKKARRICPKPVSIMQVEGLVHSVRFSSDEKYFAYCSFNPEESVCIHALERNGDSIDFERVYTLKCVDPLLQAKGIYFTRDDCYVVIAYSMDMGTVDKAIRQGKSVKSLIEIRRFYSDGSLGAVVSSIKGEDCLEDVAFIQGDTAIVLTDQLHDRLHVISFDQRSGCMGDVRIIGNPEAMLSYPHGVGISPDGTHVAITNYGTDICNIYKVDFLLSH